MRDSEIEWSYLCTPGNIKNDQTHQAHETHYTDQTSDGQRIRCWAGWQGLGVMQKEGEGAYWGHFLSDTRQLLARGKSHSQELRSGCRDPSPQSHPSLLCWRRRNYILKVGMTRVFILQRNNVQHKSWLWWSRTQECLTLAVCATFQRRMCNLLN